VSTGLVIALVTSTPAAAQGRGNGRGRGGPITSGSAAPATSTAGVRQFGSWLDDASVLAAGQAWTAVSFGRYRSPGARQTDFPIVDASIGLTPRAQMGVTVPYYRMHFTDGSGINGFGDVYFNVKLAVIDPSEDGRRFGVAVSPIIELLDRATTSTGRFAWGAPVSLEFRGDRYRLFGSAGYFSRGVLFASTAIEVPLQERLVVTGALSTMRAINDDPRADAQQLPKNRADLTAVAAWFLTPSIAAFAGTGRTISSMEGGGTSVLLTAGLSLSFAPRTAAPSRR
jgi:hypothetical protein